MFDFGFASEKEIRQEIGGRLRAHRLAQNLSQVELAKRAGFGLSTLKLLESKGHCTLENFVRAVLALGLADELQSLFVFQIKSIAQMEHAERAKRVRASRKSAVDRGPPKNADVPLPLSASRR